MKAGICGIENAITGFSITDDASPCFKQRYAMDALRIYSRNYSILHKYSHKTHVLNFCTQKAHYLPQNTLYIAMYKNGETESFSFRSSYTTRKNSALSAFWELTRAYALGVDWNCMNVCERKTSAAVQNFYKIFSRYPKHFSCIFLILVYNRWCEGDTPQIYVGRALPERRGKHYEKLHHHLWPRLHQLQPLLCGLAPLPHDCGRSSRCP